LSGPGAYAAWLSTAALPGLAHGVLSAKCDLDD
jgi:hypothetical protein